MNIRGGLSFNNTPSQCLRRNVSTVHFCTTTLQPRAVLFSSVQHKVEMLNTERKEDCTTTDMRIKDMLASGEGNTLTLIKTSKHILFISYLLLSIYHPLKIYRVLPTSFFALSQVSVHNTYRVFSHSFFFSQVSLLTLTQNFSKLPQEFVS